jgi:bacterioferritin-associated ferredoxin
MKIHEVKVGDRIRSYDFRDLEQDYLEGTVERVAEFYIHFHADLEVVMGSPAPCSKAVRTAREVIRDWSDRIQVI